LLEGERAGGAAPAVAEGLLIGTEGRVRMLFPAP